jgi:hypothetical protein
MKKQKQIIFIKADDLNYKKWFIVSRRWKRFIDLTIHKKIKVNIGIIGISLEKGNKKYIKLIKELMRTNAFEFWNHGYKHEINCKDKNGRKYDEFKNVSKMTQKERILRTQSLAKNKLNLIFRTFGSPGNSYDEKTIEVLNETQEIKIWFFGSSKSNKIILERSIEAEYPTHQPNYCKFMENYNQNLRIITLQVHPDSWSKKRFQQFVKIIEFLKSKNVDFENPYEYYKKQDENI